MAIFAIALFYFAIFHFPFSPTFRKLFDFIKFLINRIGLREEHS